MLTSSSLTCCRTRRCTIPCCLAYAKPRIQADRRFKRAEGRTRVYPNMGHGTCSLGLGGQSQGAESYEMRAHPLRGRWTVTRSQMDADGYMGCGKSRRRCEKEGSSQLTESRIGRRSIECSEIGHTRRLSAGWDGNAICRASPSTSLQCEWLATWKAPVP